MIGIVVVSHSRSLATAAVALAGEMLYEQALRIEIAAGLDETTFGTDAVAVADAITAADSGDGVLVLMDLGSAVLSAELALDLLETEHRVRLCAAPIVEGLVSAVVSAAGGAGLDEVVDEANNALLGKRTQLGEVDPGESRADSHRTDIVAISEYTSAAVTSVQDGIGGLAADSLGDREVADQSGTSSGRDAAGHDGGVSELGLLDEGGPVGAEVVAVFRVVNEHGLHARPAARLVAEIRGWDARVRLRNLTTGAGPAPGTSLTRVAALGALAGHEIEVVATGSEAGEVVRRVTDLAERGFDEAVAPRSNIEAALADGIDSGAADVVGSGPFPASAGIAIGPIWRPGAVEFDLPGAASGPPEGERERLDAALARVSDRITTAIERADGSGAGSATYARAVSANPEADVFRAHLLLLEDEELIRAIHYHIDGGAPAERAWATVLDGAAAELADLPDDYQRARAADIRAVRDQVVAALLGIDSEIDSRPGILVAADLTPGEVSALDPKIVTGILLAQGSPTAHSVILAHAKGIPAVVGVGPSVLAIPEGTTVALDGGTGHVVIDPDERTAIEFATRAEQQRDRLRAAQAAAWRPARTRDDITVHVAANVGSVADAAEAVRSGADLAGLIRTEFLFLNRDHAPSVDEQEQVYRSIARTFDGRRIVLRTLDVGGDKPLPYIRRPSEANPFLGLRGIRLALAHPDLLRDQLRAIVRVAADHPVSVMFPMVSQIAELLAARALLDSILKAEKLVREDISLKVGIMVEVPAAAAKSPIFARHVDFLSIGTNDLTQYALAAERGNAAVASEADALDPGVLQLIDWACRGSAATPVAVCGEIAADPAAIPVLLGLGVTELSVAPPAIALTKATIRDLNLPECVELARRALRSESAAEVRNQG